nr:unnamed protein product [Callosobruchus analis]
MEAQGRRKVPLPHIDTYRKDVLLKTLELCLAKRSLKCISTYVSESRKRRGIIESETRRTLKKRGLLVTESGLPSEKVSSLGEVKESGVNLNNVNDEVSGKRKTHDGAVSLEVNKGKVEDL